MRLSVKTSALFLAATWVSIWGVSYIPLDKLPFGHYWDALIYHAMCALLWLLIIRLFTPSVKSRLTLRMSRKRLIAACIVIAFFVTPNFRGASWAGNSLVNILSALLFALFIGLNEDLFSRGFIYGLLERYGVAVASVIQAIHFGALHFTNYVWGGQSLSYTSAQMVNAAAFGYLCCGLMIFTGSIWVPILLHGLSDFPLELQSQAAFTAQVTGGADWYGTVVEALLMIVVGWLLIYGPRSAWQKRLEPVLDWAGLVDLTKFSDC